MIKKCNIEDKKIILDYIGNHYYKSLYLYLNFIKYEFSNNDVVTYIQIDNNEITCVLLSFGNAIHILSKDNNADIFELCEFIEKNNYSVICTNGDIANKLYSNFKTLDFDLSIGSILELDNVNSDTKINDGVVIEKAKKEDFENLVDFLISDADKKKIYSRESLYNQICSRNLENYGRNYIIKNNKKIIAHVGTGAENHNIAVVNFVLVAEEYRGNGYATTIVKKICSDLVSEGKICYLMVLEDNVEKLYEKIGFYKKETYGKLVRKNNRR